MTLDDLAEILRRPDRAAAPRLVDLRGREAFLRRHARGSISIPWPRLPESLFLLPPRSTPLILLSGQVGSARRAASFLQERGWNRTAWFEGSLRDLPEEFCGSGWSPNRIWRPSPFLTDMEPLLPRTGAALDLACGAGREAVWLALGGRQVLGVDRLPDALVRARRLARETGVSGAGRRRQPAFPADRPPTPSISFRRVDLTDPQAVDRLLPPERWRLITCFRYLDRKLLPRLPRALSGGGALVYETFLETQARDRGRPRRPAFLLKPGELRQAFPGLRLLRYREGRDREGNWLASLAAERPSRD